MADHEEQEPVEPPKPTPRRSVRLLERRQRAEAAEEGDNDEVSTHSSEEQAPSVVASPFMMAGSIHLHRIDRVDSRARSVRSTASSLARRRRAEVELEAAEEAARLEQEAIDLQTKRDGQKLLIKKNLIEKRKEVRLAEIDEEEEIELAGSGDSQRLSDFEDIDLDMDPEPKSKPRDKVQKWIDGGVKLLDITHPNPKVTPFAEAPPPPPLGFGGYRKYVPPPKPIPRGYQFPPETTAIPKQEGDRLENALVKTLELMQLQQLSQNRAEMQGPTPLEKSQQLARRRMGDMAQFNGSPELWPSFKCEFDEGIKLCGFNHRENMSRLRKCLRGDAKEAVQQLFNDPENVPDIMKTLERRFGRPEYIIKSLLEKAKKFVPMRDDRRDLLINFATALKNLSVTVTALKRTDYLNNPILLEELLAKLPTTWQNQWASHLVSSKILNQTVKDFADWMDVKAEELSRIYTPKFATDTKAAESTSTPKARERTKKDSVLNVSAPETSTEPKKTTKVRKCTLCEIENHGLWECRKFQKQELNDRWQFVKSKKLCFACLMYGHQTENCQLKKKCGRNGCSQHHHPLLHYEKKATSPPPTKEPSSTDEKKTDTGSSKAVLQVSGEKLILKIVPVVLTGPKKSLKTYALLDEGSMYTMIEAATAAELELDGPSAPLTYSVAGNAEHRDAESRVVSLRIADAKQKRSFQLNGVRTRKNLGMPRQTVDREDLPFNWAEIVGLKLAPMTDAKPTILIGVDHFDLIANTKVKYGPKGFRGIGKTPLGWIFYGKSVIPQKRNQDGFAFCQFEKHDEDLHKLVKESFAAEALGVKVLNEKPRSKDDDRAHQIMTATTRRVGGHWETGLVWKQDEIFMPESKTNAMKRLLSMERKIDKNPQLAAEYEEKIQYYVDAGYARFLTKEEAEMTTSRTWYLPHFGVINPNKPGKMRFVFDAAAESKGVCLNSFLLPGPDLLISLPGSLLKFRQRKIGFSGDVKEFFHRIHVRKEDQDAQRFLWRGKDRDRDPDVLVMAVNIFGAACAPFTSQAAKNMNADEFREEFPMAATAITRRHYMDDYLDSNDTVQESVQLILDVVEVHRRGDFHIGKFVCSSKEVLEKIPAKLRGAEGDQNLEGEMSSERILGLIWNPNEDNLGFHLKFYKVDKDIVSGARRPTKREVLKVVMSVFDPLGLLAHYTVQGKILLQNIWRSGIGWDDQLNDELNKKWAKWIESLGTISQLKMDRCYAPEFGESGSRQLHLFCDASAQAFSAVAYLRSEDRGVVRVSLVIAKTRVAPLKLMTIPKLELQAALMASRLATFIKSELEFAIEEVHLWTDSMTVIRWLRSDARNYKIFVAHRIGEILELTDVSDWHWVPTKLNVADDATRDEKPADLTSTSRWIRGPEFLLSPKEDWPTPKIDYVEPCIEELVGKNNFVGSTAGSMTDLALPNPDRFSSWLRLIRTTGWIRRYVTNCSKRAVKPRPEGELTTGELVEAEKLWFRKVQTEAFGKELIALRADVGMSKSSRLTALSPFLDESGVIRMDGRTRAAPDLSEDAKIPIILPGDTKFTELLVAHYHRMAGHHGRERVFNNLREKYWILDMRRAVKRSWTNCQQCKNSRAKPVASEMGQLPMVRLTANVRPFTFCGVDYFGPMEVTIGRRHEKRYGVLFTCLTMRAVHLELAASLSTDSCIMALRRMISRRGSPKEMWSDNGTNFVGADNELKLALKELDQEKIKTELSSRGIDWSFIPPRSPHMGGCWERLVRSVKVALKAVLKERAPREEILQTLFAEAEYTLNSRPLTHISMDPADPRPLTPNDLLIGPGAPLPPGQFGNSDFCTRKMWRFSQILADHFWKRWIREFVPSLTRRTKWAQRAEPVKVGDIAVIVDAALERNHWPMGRVTEVFPGKDGQVRVVEIQTAHGVYRRPVVKVAVLDLDSGVDRRAPDTGGENVPNCPSDFL